MRTIDEVFRNNLHGLHYDNRIILPFKVEILKAIVENDIITDFSTVHSGAQYKINDEFTEIYFYDYKNLSEVVTQFETIKLVVVEKGKDLFDFANHRKLALHLLDKHKLTIEELNEDILFIE